jgi:hypothetical protein
MIECSFLIPIAFSPTEEELEGFDTLEEFLVFYFSGFTVHRVEGVWKNPETKKIEEENSRRYIIAVDEQKVYILRNVIKSCLIWFNQQEIYFSVGGHVEMLKEDS